jgi:manganese transport protein
MVSPPCALEAAATIPVPRPWWRRLASIAGPGAVVAVGYIDPGNWATDLAGGARHGYALLWVVLVSSLVAMLLQTMSARLGIATGLDLAQACRAAYPRLIVPMWLAAEVAVVATDVAEVLGSALALEMLLGVPLRAGVLLTAADVLVLLAAERVGSRAIERLLGALVLLVAVAFAFELALSRPALTDVLRGYLPSPGAVRDPQMLYLAVGILGATVMPHNLYLHSSLVKSLPRGRTDAARREALRYATLDTVLSLGGAMVLNSALLVLAAAVFHGSGRIEVAELQDAHRLLTPLLGSAAAAVFALALLAAGQSATITGTMSGQVVMSGFVRLRLKPWQRRLLTRALAIVPALGVLVVGGEGRAGGLLVASQVVLSLQLPFAIVPLLRLTSDPRTMGRSASPRWMTLLGWAGAAIVVAANSALLWQLAAP